MTFTTVAKTQNRPLTVPLVMLLALACGLGVGSSYYAQPLAGPIAQSLGIDLSLSGLIVALAQAGYVAGLVLVVPLGDLIENRRLVSLFLGIAAAALLAMTLAPSGASFLCAALVLGLAAAGIQVIVALVSRLAAADARGRLIGYVTSGIFLGILLARPGASLLAHFFGWRSAFLVPAILMAGLSLALHALLPDCRPEAATLGYGGMLRSLPPLLIRTPVLRRRIGYHAAIFSGFSLFWTAVPLLLAEAPFSFSQKDIGFFALAGAAGVVAAPLAGRAGDRGWTDCVTGVALGATGVAFALAFIAAELNSVVLLICAAVVIDLALAANLVLSQRAILTAGSTAGNRLNSLFRMVFLAAGAGASAVAAFVYATAGWGSVACIGLGLAATGLLYYLTELAAYRRVFA